MKSYLITIVTCGALLTACASSSVMDLDASTIKISTSAAPVCGARGVQEVASKRAAIETINRGFDRYIIIGAQAQNSVGVVGHTPIIANTHGNGNVNVYGNTATYNSNSTTYVTGGQPIIGGTHDQALAVRMFTASDPDGQNAIDARRVLGPDWKKVVAKGGGLTC